MWPVVVKDWRVKLNGGCTVQITVTPCKAQQPPDYFPQFRANYNGTPLAFAFTVSPTQNMITSPLCALPAGERGLLDRIARQDAVALGELYDQYSLPLYSLAYRMLADRVEADAVLQKVFFRIWEEAAGLDHPTINVFHWLTCITREEAQKVLRQRRLPDGNKIHGPAKTENIFPLEDISVPAFTTDSRCMVNTLTADERQAIEDVYFNGLTCSEISKKLDEPVAVIRARINSGMSRLYHYAGNRDKRNLGLL
jgi:RNA polymerase sigma-70 factor (ECF subfamily)